MKRLFSRDDLYLLVCDWLHNLPLPGYTGTTMTSSALSAHGSGSVGDDEDGEKQEAWKKGGSVMCDYTSVYDADWRLEHDFD